MTRAQIIAVLADAACLIGAAAGGLAGAAYVAWLMG